MKKWLLLVPLLLGLSLFSSGQSGPNPDQNCNLWGANPTTTQCGGTTSAASGTQLFFPDIRGTITNQFEIVVQGTAPATLTMTVVGCMRGGTCSGTIASSSGTASQIVTPTAASLNIYDKYGVTLSWTGGDATTRFVVNRTGTVARLQTGAAGAGTVSANNGVAGAIANYAAAGGSTTVGPATGVVSPSAGELDVGTNGGTGGVIGWNGATSGKATCTAPAVAGTNTNPLLCTNQFSIPGLQLTVGAGTPGNGIYNSASTNIIITSAGAQDALFNGTSVELDRNINDSSGFLMISMTAPTISSGFGTGPSVVNAHNTFSFQINVGTGGTASTGVIGLPAGHAGWKCSCDDITTVSSTVFTCRQTGASTTTTAPIGEFTAAGAAQAWNASDILNVSCAPF